MVGPTVGGSDLQRVGGVRGEQNSGRHNGGVTGKIRFGTSGHATGCETSLKATIEDVVPPGDARGKRGLYEPPARDKKESGEGQSSRRFACALNVPTRGVQPTSALAQARESRVRH